jgi:hypothetical protein
MVTQYDDYGVIKDSTVEKYNRKTGKENKQPSKIEVCKTKHLTDYKIVTDWINKNYQVDPPKVE